MDHSVTRDRQLRADKKKSNKLVSDVSVPADLVAILNHPVAKARGC